MGTPFRTDFNTMRRLGARMLDDSLVVASPLQSILAVVATVHPHDLGMNLRRNVSDPKLDRIRRVPGFRSMSEDELARLAALVDECEVPEGSVLTREGAAGRSTYVIVDGYASVTVAGTPIAALGPGDHIGEMSVLDNKPRSATVVAKTAMTLLEIGPAALGELLQHPAVVRSIARGLSTRLRAADASVDATSARP